jgi:hypothetical protein
MSLFYLLPPRPLLNQRFKDFARLLLPGLASAGPVDFVALLHELARQQPDVYLVHREDLPEEDDPVQSLVDGFGAEAGDEIVEIRTGFQPTDTSIRRWCVGRAA